MAASAPDSKAQQLRENMLGAFLTVNGDPMDYPESQTLPDKAKWQEATDVELKSCHDHEVWDWVDPEEVPEGAEIVSSRM
eukprot:3399666-Rhodomonas_salina.1